MCFLYNIRKISYRLSNMKNQKERKKVKGKKESI